MRRRNWDRHEIKAAIHRRGKTLFALAQEAGIEASSCWVALNRRHRAGEAAISNFLNVPLSVLWPDRYPSAALRRASNDAASRVASQKLGAA